MTFKGPFQPNPFYHKNQGTYQDLEHISTSVLSLTDVQIHMSCLWKGNLTNAEKWSQAALHSGTAPKKEEGESEPRVAS